MLQWLSDWLFGRGPSSFDRFKSATLQDTTLMSIDLELTSLNANESEITSFGWVCGRNSSIALETCTYSVVKTKAPLGQSPVIHGLIQDNISKGEKVEDVLTRFIAQLPSKILVIHNANLDLAVLDAVFRRLNLPAQEVYYIDTLQLALYELKKEHEVVPSNSASLGACLLRAGLPEVPQHNALEDAMAALLLCYAQLASLGLTEQSCLADLSHTKALGRKTLGVVKT
ncbi:MULTISPECIES: 3'-5' exonuclease [Alteromonas]|jgi:DNA polymerase-3 subunit epsilon|uniref:DNA polymerase III subunit epsilon n=1 Tax=Alteromonas stellipolaris TaxID=233316 RepID=A0ABM5YMH6_9ALTE|nr:MULTISPECIES: 3'-5' exonuclease [Alteromonas]AMJ92029.1 DNA polymerase III subunit epsilon [Alteromonas sp. Mac2]ALM89090.1 DNA polymerase III epsilon subunit [Alteromonas stellipolaris LMG 21856]AMJ75741.1 DNA polymerase III subunit epsilon [Alteromonas stellipolaris]AMJ88166.1 DNA polymerase III subunit epsilon [Alteromonas sp. Mac1]AMJ95846.1 DNA polymerase III subunit epsilon [Alteromonas stellipolaris]